jgi:hypothetical protein
MNSLSANMKIVTRILLVATFALAPIVPESVFADPYSRPSLSPRSSPSYTSPYSSSYRSPSYTSPSLPSYTYKSQSKSYGVGDYSRHTYKYTDSLGNRYKSETRVLPGGTTVTKGKYRSRSSHLSPPLPAYTYRARTNSYRVGDYHWQTYKYKDSLGNRHKGTIEVFPGGTVRHKGKVNGKKFKETERHR